MKREKVRLVSEYNKIVSVISSIYAKPEFSILKRRQMLMSTEKMIDTFETRWTTILGLLPSWEANIPERVKELRAYNNK